MTPGESQIMEHDLYHSFITRLVKHVSVLLDTQYFLHTSLIIGEHEAWKIPAYQILSLYFKAKISQSFLKTFFFLFPGKYETKAESI